ncbi:MAG: hypothetical protein NZ108_06165, partial [Bacteroidia bacterium]|nr:hypothetical protein [Bacteroidia bacterium]
FLIEGYSSETELPNWFLTGLKVLSDDGIGGYKSSGNGKFTYTIEPFTLEVPDEAKYMLNLSIYCPQFEEIESGLLGEETGPGGWSLIQTGGWLTQDVREDGRALRKCPVYCFAEGSVFRRISAIGKLLDLKPAKTEIPAYRNCRSIFIPIHCPNSDY